MRERISNVTSIQTKYGPASNVGGMCGCVSHSPRPDSCCNGPAANHPGSANSTAPIGSRSMDCQWLPAWLCYRHATDGPHLGYLRTTMGVCDVPEHLRTRFTFLRLSSHPGQQLRSQLSTEYRS